MGVVVSISVFSVVVVEDVVLVVVGASVVDVVVGASVVVVVVVVVVLVLVVVLVGEVLVVVAVLFGVTSTTGIIFLSSVSDEGDGSVGGGDMYGGRVAPLFENKYK